MVRVSFVVILYCVCVLTPSTAQNGSVAPSQGTSRMSEVIDGSVHPELIPDATAYRLWFIASSEFPNATPAEQMRQKAHLGRAGLSDTDIQAAAGVLASFKVQYSQLIAHYNESDTKDLGALIHNREGLVQATRDSLRVVLTPEGMAKIDAHVQREKRLMKVAKEGQ